MVHLRLQLPWQMYCEIDTGKNEYALERDKDRYRLPHNAKPKEFVGLTD